MKTYDSARYFCNDGQEQHTDCNQRVMTEFRSIESKYNRKKKRRDKMSNKPT